jgi:hypothetical protein
VSAGVLQTRSGVTTPILVPGVGFGANGFSMQFATSAFGGTAHVYCKAGDILQPMFFIDGDPSTTNVLSGFTVYGDASGQKAWWSLCLANRSLN